MLSLNLLLKGAVVPQIFINAQTDYLIRWLPAMLDKNVRALLQQAENNLPETFVQYQSGKKVLPCDDAALQLFSFFLTHFITAWGHPDKEDAVTLLFFQASPQPFSSFGQQAVPSGIAAWLSRFRITHQQYVPVLKIEEADDDAFAVSLEVKDSSRRQELPVSLESVLLQKKFEKLRYTILQNVALLANFIPGLDAYLHNGAKRPIVMNAQSFASFLFDMLPAIRLLDIKTILPKALSHILKPQVTVKLKKKATGTDAFIRLDDLLSFDWQIAVGNDYLDEAEFLKLISRSHGLVKFRNQYVFLDPREVERLQKALQQPKRMNGIELLRTALGGEIHGRTRTHERRSAGVDKSINRAE